jgi:hypothetical protein
MTIPFNPNVVTNAQGGFLVETSGYIAGLALDDPHIRNELRGGPLAATEVLPMWGGIPVSVGIPPPIPDSQDSLGNPIVRATTVAQILGWSVFNQDHSMISSTSSPVPQAANGMMVAYYLTGSRARIPVPCDPAIASLVGGVINPAIGWDFTQMRVIVGGALPVEILHLNIGNSMVPVYNAVTGALTWNRQGSVAVIKI